MHKMDLFTAMFDYIEDLFTMKLKQNEKQSIMDAFEMLDIEDGIERTIKAIETGLHIKLPMELFMETRIPSNLKPIELQLKRLNFEASMWYSETHSLIEA